MADGTLVNHHDKEKHTQSTSRKSPTTSFFNRLNFLKSTSQTNESPLSNQTQSISRNDRPAANSKGLSSYTSHLHRRTGSLRKTAILGTNHNQIDRRERRRTLGTRPPSTESTTNKNLSQRDSVYNPRSSDEYPLSQQPRRTSAPGRTSTDSQLDWLDRDEASPRSSQEYINNNTTTTINKDNNDNNNLRVSLSEEELQLPLSFGTLNKLSNSTVTSNDDNNNNDEFTYKSKTQDGDKEVHKRASSPLSSSLIVSDLRTISPSSSNTTNTATNDNLKSDPSGKTSSSGDDAAHSYNETEWWGWVLLLSTWIIFVVGMGSCLDIWRWAWDVGQTPAAPPELSDDNTLPIVGYYPTLIILTGGVMAWVWVVVAWVGLKYFKHAKIQND